MKIKFNLPYKRIMTYVYLLVIGGGIFTVSFTAYFLYRDFYQALTQSSVVVDLQGKVAIESINVKKFEQIMAKIDQRRDATSTELTSNIFR